MDIPMCLYVLLMINMGVMELVVPEREAGYKFFKILLNVVGLEREERRRLLSTVRNSLNR